MNCNPQPPWWFLREAHFWCFSHLPGRDSAKPLGKKGVSLHVGLSAPSSGDQVVRRALPEGGGQEDHPHLWRWHRGSLAGRRPIRQDTGREAGALSTVRTGPWCRAQKHVGFFSSWCLGLLTKNPVVSQTETEKDGSRTVFCFPILGFPPVDRAHLGTFSVLRRLGGKLIGTHWKASFAVTGVKNPKG